jgi:hypothetical protein
MEHSDRRSTLVILDKSLKQENDPCPISLPGRAALPGWQHSDINFFPTEGKTIPIDCQGKKVGGSSAPAVKTIRPQLTPQGDRFLFSQLSMPAATLVSARCMY